MKKNDVNRANQLNPMHDSFWKSRGLPKPCNPMEVAKELKKKTILPKHALDNRSRQLNPNDKKYWESRGIKK